jgi:hypothetical protein
MKTEAQIRSKILEHDLQIYYVKSLSIPENLITIDVKRLEYGRKALLWVLSDDELLKPEL